MRRAGWCICLIAMIAPVRGRGDDGTELHPSSLAHEGGNRVWLDLEMVPTADANVLAFGLNGQVQVHRNVVLYAEVPAAVGAVNGEPAIHAAPGNVTIGVHCIGLAKGPMIMWGGISISIPTLYSAPATNSGLAETNVAALATAARDGADSQRFAPGSLTPRTDFGFELPFATRWRYRFEITNIWYEIPLWNQKTQDWNGNLPVGTDIFASSSEFRVDVWRGLYAGARLQFVGFAPSIAGGLFVGYDPPRDGFEVRLGWLIGTFPYVAAEDPYFSLFNSVALRVGYLF